VQHAAEALRCAITVNPHNARGVADLANVLSATGKAPRALELCETFLAQHPGERMVVASYAYALHDADRTEEARALLDFESFIKPTNFEPPKGYDTMEDLNQALAAIVEDHPSLLANPLNKATRGGSQTGELDLDDDEALVALETMIRKAVVEAAAQYRASGAARHSLLADPPDAWTLRPWGTLLREGGQQTPHIHPLGWLSGAYYVRLPEDMSASSDQAGWLEFGAPPPRYRVKAEPELHVVEPKPGCLVLFPSYFYHQTIPFASSETRISIAFDVIPTRLLKP
jgi:uncharacterized protein (TIGR02466 family)